MKKILFVLMISIVCILLVGCTLKESKPKNLESVSVRLKWLHQAQFAGIYVAKEKGFYEQNGLTVDIKEGGVASPSIEDVVSGSSDYGISGADDILVAISKGAPIKAIAVIYKVSPVCYFSLKESEIKRPEDLIGKTVGMKRGTGTTYSYYAILNNLGIDKSKVKEFDVGYDLALLYNKTVDVWPGFRINEPLIAIEQGYEINELFPEDWGVSMYADVLFTTKENIEKNPDEVKRFVKSTLEGWQYAIANEDEAVNITMEYAKASDKKHQAVMLRASLPLISTGNSYLGIMEKTKWESTKRILVSSNLLPDNLSIDEAYTNEFI